MKHFHFYLLFILLFTVQQSFAQWTTLSTDATGDGASSTLLDGKTLSYRYVPATDSLFFKIDVAKAVNPPFGLNLVFAVTGAGAATTWNTPQNASFLYNRVITAWYATTTTGILGISDAIGFSSGNYTNIMKNGAVVTVDLASNSYIVAVKRTDLYNGSGAFDADVIAAVGSNMNWNDDVPSSGSGHIHIPTTAINNVANNNNDLTISPNPSKGIFCFSIKNSDKPLTIHITNIKGETVYNSTIPNNSMVNLSHLCKGYYVTTVIAGAEKSTQQIVIE